MRYIRILKLILLVIHVQLVNNDYLILPSFGSVTYATGKMSLNEPSHDNSSEALGWLPSALNSVRSVNTPVQQTCLCVTLDSHVLSSDAFREQ
jgi:hypothetical protein